MNHLHTLEKTGWEFQVFGSFTYIYFPGFFLPFLEGSLLAHVRRITISGSVGKKTLNVKFLMIRFFEGIFFPFAVMEKASGPWLRDKSCSQWLLEWFWGRKGTGVVFGSFSAAVVQTLPSLEGRQFWVLVLDFLLPRGLAVIAEPSLLFLLTNGGLMLVGATIELWIFSTSACWGRPSSSAWVPQGKTAPHLFRLSVMEALRKKKCKTLWKCTDTYSSNCKVISLTWNKQTMWQIEQTHLFCFQNFLLFCAFLQSFNIWFLMQIISSYI